MVFLENMDSRLRGNDKKGGLGEMERSGHQLIGDHLTDRWHCREHVIPWMSALQVLFDTLLLTLLEAFLDFFEECIYITFQNTVSRDYMRYNGTHIYEDIVGSALYAFHP